ncbi:MAG: CHAT domain-containing protein [Pirellulales bacterium]
MMFQSTRRPKLTLLLGAVWAVLALGGGTLHAQRFNDRTIIKPVYFAALAEFYTGDFEDALDGFLDAGRQGIRTADARWIDSICYHTMTGETYYQMGNLAKAREHFDSALRLYVAHSQWMMHVQFPNTIQADNIVGKQPPPWGNTKRQRRLGKYPQTMLIARTRVNVGSINDQTVVQNQDILYPLHVEELVRCTCLAIRRRAEILGPLGEHDDLTKQVLEHASKRQGQPNHWSEAWLELQLGIAYQAAGKTNLATASLQRALVAAGQWDHSLTGLAQLELGKIALAQMDFPTAANLFEEASYSSYHYEDPLVLEESLRWGAIVHLLGNRQGLYPPLEAAAGWSRNKRDLAIVYASVLNLAAEGYAALGDLQRANGALQTTRRAIGRRGMSAGRLGAQRDYIAALVGYASGNKKAGDEALAAVMDFQRRGGSLRLAQVAIADEMYTSGMIRARTAVDVYANVLRDPTPTDWALEPKESLTILLTPQSGSLDRWFEAAIERDDVPLAIEVADRARRLRFFSSLPMGGRLLNLRWILEAPEARLDNIAKLQRQDILVRFPALQQNSQKIADARRELAAMPISSNDRTVQVRQGALYEQLTSLAQQQELLLHAVALRRVAAEMVFPPVRTVAEVQAKMNEGEAVLVFYQARGDLYGFLFNKTRAGWWKVASPAELTKRLSAWFREMGHFDGNREIEAEMLADDKWKVEAREVLDHLMLDSKIDLSQGITDLTIVPDGILWYVPFEALQVGPKLQPQSLLEVARLRYAPTVGLAMPDDVGRRSSGSTAVVQGKLYPREDDALVQRAFEQVRRSVAGAQAVPALPAAPSSIFVKLLDAVIVFADLPMIETDGADFYPLLLDQGKPGGTLRDWLGLPFGGPEIVVLPGFHTPAESSLKRMPRGVARPGDEVYLTVMNLMASGARTVLLSRWRVGGNSTYQLVTELIAELPNTSAQDAWQRSVQLLQERPIDPTAEPRVRPSRDGRELLGKHPFFWSGYLLIDTGVRPEKAPAAVPQLQFPGG